MLQLRTLPTHLRAEFEAAKDAAAEISRSKQKPKTVLIAK
jgi:hypothetical protein